MSHLTRTDTAFLGALAGALVATVSPGAAVYLLLLTVLSRAAVGIVQDIRAERLTPSRRVGTASLPHPRRGVEAGTFVAADPRTREGRDARQRTTSAVTTITMPGPYSRFGRKK